MTKRIFSILILFLLLIPILVNAQDNQKQGYSFSPVWSEGKNANGARESVVPQKPIETKETKEDFKMTTLEIILLITTIICGFFGLHYKGQKGAFEARYYYYEKLLYAGLSETEAMEETQRKYNTVSKAFLKASEDMKGIFKEALNKGGHKTM